MGPGMSRFRRAVVRVMSSMELNVLAPFSNQDYNEEERDDMLAPSCSKTVNGGVDEDEEGNLDAEMRKFDIEMKKLMLTQEKESLDLSTVNCQRRSGEQISSLQIGAEDNVRLIKLASLEGKIFSSGQRKRYVCNVVCHFNYDNSTTIELSWGTRIYYHRLKIDDKKPKSLCTIEFPKAIKSTIILP